ncbi:MAG: ABC transporter permease, partial [Cytophagaceae bacterium]|nr:ABC transporter permease [Gemmatimonadaceae bacterium]
QRFREEGRDARGDRLVRELWSDVRYAVRVLRRAPLFTTVAVVTLGLGIGANSAIFSVVNAVVLRPLGFADEASLMSVWDGGHSLAEFVAVRDRVRSLSASAAYQPGYDFTLGGEGEPERVVSALVTADFFSMLGVGPAQGRFFSKGDDVPGAEPVVVLSDALWRRRFGGDPSLIGGTVELDGIRRQVIGIAPPSFTFPTAGTRMWVPLEIDPAREGLHWGAYGHYMLGRLAPGRTPAQLRDEVAGLALDLIGENPVWKPDSSFARNITVTPLREHLVKESRPLLFLLSGAVGLVLLVACANVANLLMVRGTARERELAIRTTLGAGARRLARQLLTESLVLATAGGVLGLVIAWALTGALVGLLPDTTPRLAETSLDPLVVAFTLSLALFTGLLFGVLPARRIARQDPAAMMHGTRATAGARQRRVAGFLVSAQIATAVILAVGAGLVVRSLGRLLAVDPGFETGHVVTAKVSPPRASYQEKAAQRAVTTQVLNQLRGAPGIQGVAVTTQVPFEPRNEVMAMWVDGWTTDPNKLEVFEVRRVSPDFFRVMGIPVKRGRVFLDADNEGATPVAVISQSAVDKYWSGRDPLQGGRLRFPWPGWQQVVGVVADVRNNDLRNPALPTIYLSYAQDPRAFVSVVARTAGDPQQALAAIRTTVRAVAPDVAVSDEQLVQQMVERSVSAPRSVGLLLVSFGVLALVLGGIGTYGLVAYGVESRRQEFAVRMAVGAGQPAVMRLVMREGLRLAAIGIIVGLAAAFWLTKLLQNLLYGIERTDFVSFAVAPIVLGAVTVLACALPAWRATRVDPNGALRGD